MNFLPHDIEKIKNEKTEGSKNQDQKFITELENFIENLLKEN